MSAEVTQQLDRAMVDDLFGGASEYARPLVVSRQDRSLDCCCCLPSPAGSMAMQPARAEAAVLTACLPAAVPKQEIQAAAFLKVG